MILITGAAGKTGKAILRKVTDVGGIVKAWVFRVEQIKEVEALGSANLCTTRCYTHKSKRCLITGKRCELKNNCSFAKMFDYYEKYGFYGNSQGLSWLLNRPPTSLEAFIKHAVQARLHTT